MHKQVKILFIESNPEDIEIISGFLEKTGGNFNLTQVESPEKAIKVLCEKKIDIVMVDPVTSGKQCHEFFQCLKKRPELPLIILTSFEKDLSEWNKNLPEIHIYLYRHTLSSEALLDAIRTALEHRRLVVELGEAMGRLEKSNSALEQFAYAISHDLNEPLRSITGYIQLLSKRHSQSLDEQGRHYVDKIENASKKLQEMIAGVLDYSRLGNQKRELAPVDCNEMIGEVLAGLEAAIGETHAEIKCSKLPIVKGDRIQLMRVFQNLISNAIKFQKHKVPVVSISAKRQAGFFLFSVKDNGIGIDPKHFDSIFVIFKRLHSREEFKGSGVGLSVCKKIVESHGGKIWVKSESGKGTTFNFTIPCMSKRKSEI